MTLSPVVRNSRGPLFWMATEAMAPPMPWRTIETMSQGMNYSQHGKFLSLSVSLASLVSFAFSSYPLNLCRYWRGRGMKLTSDGTHNSCIPPRRQPRMFLAVHNDNPSQTQINPRRKESRRDSQTNKLHNKPILSPLILPAHYSSSIS